MSHPLVNNPSPALIREHLPPEDLEGFDQQWSTAITRAAASLDFTDLNKRLESWRLIALSFTLDPDHHRATLVEADRILAGGEIHSTPLSEVLEKMKTRMAS